MAPKSPGFTGRLPLVFPLIVIEVARGRNGPVAERGGGKRAIGLSIVTSDWFPTTPRVTLVDLCRPPQ